MKTFGDWAAYYAGLGFAVFPVKPKSKAPATPEGVKDASKDINKIHAWWNKNPNYNIGIATGAPSGGLVVVDLDIDEVKGINGYETVKEWQQSNGNLPDTVQSITGRGGYHLFYRCRGTNKNRVGLYEGIDIRADGGYIIAPPSIHPNGNRYEWEQSPDEFHMAQENDTLQNFLSGPFMEQTRERFSLPDQIPEGSRVSTLVQYIGSERGRNVPQNVIEQAVWAMNEHCDPPLTEMELKREVLPAIKNLKPGTYTTTKSGIVAPKKKKIITSVGAMSLLEKDLPPTEFIVDRLITKGLGGLSAKSKLGKSRLALQLAIAVSTGSDFLGFKTMKVGTLYIDLENTMSITQERLSKMILDKDPEDAFLRFQHNANRMGEGFEEDLVDFLSLNPMFQLVIIDIFQKVKKGKKLTQSDYEAEYENLTILKDIAEKTNSCILPIYHDRKMVDPNDPFSNTIGSTAIQGVSDFGMSLFKAKREDKEATLAVTGRTLEDISLKLVPDGLRWKSLGNVVEVAEQRRWRDYDQDPIVNTIRKLLQQGKGYWRGRTKEIISSSQYFKGCHIYGTSQVVSKKIINLLPDLQKYDEIFHYFTEKGTASKIHNFESKLLK